MLTKPSFLLRFEDGSLLLAAIFLYSHLHLSWLLFGVLFLAPDLFMLGYLLNPRLGSAAYNAGHFMLVPLALFAVAVQEDWHTLLAVSIIWFSHIVFDRLMGYGFKYPTHFKDTHLQHLG